MRALLSVVQIVGGFVSGSTALVANALNGLAEMTSHLIVLAGRRLARHPPTKEISFSYGRIETVAALVSCSVIPVIGLYLVYVSLVRMAEPAPINGRIVVVVAVIVLLTNAIVDWLTRMAGKGSATTHSFSSSELSSALSTAAVVSGGALLMLYDIRWVDPFVAAIIASRAVWTSVSEVARTLRSPTLEARPKVDAEEIIRQIKSVDEVESVHHAHFWLLDPQSVALDAHIVVSTTCWQNAEAVRDRIEAMLIRKFGIVHSTLELETPNRELDECHAYGM
ncbi:cation diffusion facilitator family transporter [Leisingera sp. F5]|uniref:cation diffusion facilitator family transporter n=1 Tax=Leisingera sp. F5 TaxID=1813816 RepID=UPI0023ECFA43|nr:MULTISPECIES: cation diffusion facilitator family transporter [Leisingera]